MSNNQVEGKIIELTGEWDNHTIMTWVYEKGMSYISHAKKKAYMMWIFLNYRRTLYKDIPLTLYVKIDNVMDKENANS